MLAPLRLGKRFVLVGDHYQLPPLVRDPVAKRSGMDTSLFLRLSEAHPHAVSATPRVVLVAPSADSQ